jgi:hypothetical protein
MCVRTTRSSSCTHLRLGAGGHVHYLELDQFVGEKFLVTIHGPLNPKAPLEAALRETNAVAARLRSGRLQPTRRSASPTPLCPRSPADAQRLSEL